MLTKKQIKQLKSLANTCKDRYQVGKNAISDSLIDMLDKALVAHELIKVDVQKGFDAPIMELALDLSSRLNAEVIQVVGHVITLFRRNKEHPIINLVK